MDITYKDLDLELEKAVFLFNAVEGNPGIYELTWELSCYKLNVEDKYQIAHNLLRAILDEGLGTLEKYQDLALVNKIETISLERTEEIINNPNSWYPCNEIISLTPTEKGVTFLKEYQALNQDILLKRLFKRNKA
jgi:hypothetical protein